jgi:anti-sigma B factor antagonist
MQITTEESRAVAIATVAGDLDGLTAPDVQGRLLALIVRNPKLVMDMSRVGLLSSAGLRVMLMLYRQAAARNGRIVLVGASDEIKDTLSMTGFLHFFTLASSVDEGTRLLGGG